MKEALKLALDVLNESWHLTPKPDYVRVAITAIEAALAQQEPWCMKMNGCTTKCEDCPDEPAQEPVAWLTKDKFSNKVDLDTKNAKETTGWSAAFPVYTAPQQRPWVGLTHQEISNEVISDEPDFVQGFVQGARWADALLEEKNT